MDNALTDTQGRACKDCGTALSPHELSCPGCQRLVHAEQLKQLSSEAEAATQAGDLSQALTLWRQVQELLPPESRQFSTVHEKIVELSRAVAQHGSVAPGSKAAAKSGSKLGPLGAIGAMLVFVLSKAKFLALGLSKATTLWTMFLAFGVYWTLWGWKFAAGFVLSIYIHEMGHVAALRKFGIRATAPMFIPGVGAIVRMNQYPATPNEMTYVGLAGPIWGLGAACLCGVIFLATENPLFAALTHVGALINLFNLIPIMGLDGDHGYKALSRMQRFAVLLCVGIAWYITGEGMLMLLLIVCGLRMLGKGAPEKPDASALIKYIVLVTALTALCVATSQITPVKS